MIGGAATVMVAVAVFPAPPFDDVTAEVVFTSAPEAAPVTVIVNRQVPFTGKSKPESVIVFPPLTASVPVPQTVLIPLATVSPDGNVSVKPTPVRPTVFAL